MEAAVQPHPTTPVTLLRGKVARLEPAAGSAACILSDGGRILVSKFLTPYIRPGYQIDLPLALDAPDARTEIYLRKTSAPHDVYQAPIGYAAQPKSDKREQLYVRAAVSQESLGISALHFPCEVLRDYFYAADRRLPWEKQKTFYDILRSSPSASPSELRLAFKLRELELRAEGAAKAALAAAERAFNILSHPELWACYEALLSNPTAPSGAAYSRWAAHRIRAPGRTAPAGKL